MTQPNASDPLRDAAQAVVSLETTFSGAAKYGHLPEGPIDADGYCRLCGRTNSYDGWHDRAAAIEALRAALATPPPALDVERCEHPANALSDHADNPSRFRCTKCGSVLVDYGDGMGYVNRSEPVR